MGYRGSVRAPKFRDAYTKRRLLLLWTSDKLGGLVQSKPAVYLLLIHDIYYHPGMGYWIHFLFNNFSTR